MNDLELLNIAIKQGMIDLQAISNEITMKAERKYLNQHSYKIWKGRNGKWYTYLPEPSGRKQVCKNTEEELNQLIVAFYEARDPDSDPTFKQEFEAWLGDKIQYHEIKESSALRYRDDWNRHLEGTPFSKKKMSQITDMDLDDLIRGAIIKKHLTAKSWAGLRTVLMGVLKYAKRKHHISFSPSVYFKDLQLSKNMFERPASRRKSVYGKDDRAKLYEYLMSNPDIYNLGLALMCLTGLRIGELSTLKKSDNVEDCRLLILRTETRCKKDGKMTVKVSDTPKMDHDGDIVIPKAAQHVIDLAHMQTHDCEFLFSDENKKRIKGFTFRRRLQKACKEAGVVYRPPHQMRKTFASILLASGVDEAIIKKEMRHTDISTTRSYYQFITDSTEREKSIIDRVMGL